MTFAHQDWETVVFKKHGNNGKNTDGPKETVNKVSGVVREYSDRARKLEADLNGKPTDAAPDLAALPVLDSDMRKMMIQSRVAKKMTQEQLAQQANTQPKIIKDLEGGKVVTDRAVLQRVNRILGTKLRFT